MDSALAPLAYPEHQPECFFERYRLLSVDGTQWSVSNTPAVVAALAKAASRRFSAAFAKLRLVSVVELGTHVPAAALAAPVSESEQSLAQQLRARIPEYSLIIGDRLFGTPRALLRRLRAGESATSLFWFASGTTLEAKCSSACRMAAWWYRSR
jgi:hypothetical protein